MSDTFLSHTVPCVAPGSAMSVARVLDVFTIPSSSSGKGRHPQDLFCIAIHYYWRWGQIFVGADCDPETALSEGSAELLLQQDLCDDGTYRVSGEEGTPSLPMPSCHMRRLTLSRRTR